MSRPRAHKDVIAEHTEGLFCDLCHRLEGEWGCPVCDADYGSCEWDDDLWWDDYVRGDFD
jgi:hypothetical protein